MDESLGRPRSEHLQEAKDSSEIENIVATHDELFRDAASPAMGTSPAAKEVLRYRQALRVGFELVRGTGMLTNNHIMRIQAELEKNEAGFRKVPGTSLKSHDGRVVYVPPQGAREVVTLMDVLERFINDDPAPYAADPLIRMALIHHQFETIHPFHDGNGRTGRIINRHIVRTKSEYYRLLQAVREDDAWEEWVLYMLTAVAESARQGIATVAAIRQTFLDVKHRVRRDYRFYSQDLINNLFSHPYTKIQFVEQELGVSRLTATRYLDALSAGGILRKVKIGRSNFYINVALYDILAREGGATRE